MSAFYASKVAEVAAAGEAHNNAMRERYPLHEDRLNALNLNIMLALVGDSQVWNQRGPVIDCYVFLFGGL